MLTKTGKKIVGVEMRNSYFLSSFSFRIFASFGLAELEPELDRPGHTEDFWTSVECCKLIYGYRNETEKSKCGWSRLQNRDTAGFRRPDSCFGRVLCQSPKRPAPPKPDESTNSRVVFYKVQPSCSARKIEKLFWELPKATPNAKTTPPNRELDPV